MEALLAVIGIFGMPVFIVFIYFHFANKSKEQFHTTLHELIESGQELSPELLQSIPGYKKENENGKRNDIRTGTITSGVGIGIVLFGQAKQFQVGVSEAPLVGIGLLVLSIGLGILAYGIYNKHKKVNDVS